MTATTLAEAMIGEIVDENSHAVISAARNGDRSGLIAILRSDIEMSQELRSFIASVIEGGERLPEGRLTKNEIEEMKAVYEFYQSAYGRAFEESKGRKVNLKALRQRLARAYGVSEGTVQNALYNYKNT